MPPLGYGKQVASFKFQRIYRRALPQDKNLWETRFYWFRCCWKHLFELLMLNERKKKAVNDSCYCKKPVVQPSPKLITVHCKTTCVSFPTILFKRLSQNVTDLTVRSLKIRKKFSISWLCCKANIALQLEDLFSPTCLPQTPL